MLFSAEDSWTRNSTQKDQAITTTADSTNDLLLADNAGLGNPVPILIQVTTTFTDLTSLQVELITSSVAAFTAGALTETIFDSGAVALSVSAGTLVQGYKFGLNYLPRNAQEYNRLVFTKVGTLETAGEIQAGILFPGEQTAKNTFPT